MLLTEEQTRHYLTDMINHYGEKEQDAVTSEPEHKKKAFEAMKIVLFGDDYNGHSRQQSRNTTA